MCRNISFYCVEHPCASVCVYQRNSTKLTVWSRSSGKHWSGAQHSEDFLCLTTQKLQVHSFLDKGGYLGSPRERRKGSKLVDGGVGRGHCLGQWSEGVFGSAKSAALGTCCFSKAISWHSRSWGRELWVGLSSRLTSHLVSLVPFKFRNQWADSCLCLSFQMY